MMRATPYMVGLAAALAAVPARADGLSVKTGLWEMITPPGYYGRGRVRRERICLTQAMLDKAFTESPQSGYCFRIPLTAGPSELLFKECCGGGQPTTGTLRIDAVDSQTVIATSDLAWQAGRSSTGGRSTTGKWLS